MTRIVFFIALALFTSLTTSGQIRTCGSTDHMNQLLDNPRFKAEWELRQQNFKLVNQNQSANKAMCPNPVILPVAVHYQGISNPNQACLTTLAEDQIRILNEDYQGTNADISNWNNNDAAYFPGISNGETCIQFCLASTNHPTGYGLVEGQPAVTFNTTSGDFNSAFSGYINIYVRNVSVLGYSPLGGSGNGDGVVVDDQAFGSNSVSGCGTVSPGAPYNLGRTLTHELGHYLNLDHIWGNGCNVDDGVSDTPNSNNEYYGCPNIPSSSCGSNDMLMNYMDYTNDACMYMFSAGQSTRMENYTAANLQNVINKGMIVCGPPPAPTCNDGIQNGNETGIDCGGSCPDPCPTCTDGVQNGKETGVDCGGPDCPPCPCAGEIIMVTITFDDYPEDISWTIIDASGTTVMSGGSYGGEPDRSTIVINGCVPSGCFDFTINDSYGDGLCCQYGNGSYQVTDSNGAVLASGATFTTVETTNFCISNQASVQVDLKAFLEGSYSASSLNMSDGLRQANYVPLIEPYTDLGFTHVANPGGETLDNPNILNTTGNNAIVDWMFIELHDASSPAAVTATRSALVQRDGDIVDMDGTSPVSFDGIAPGNYYVAVRQRNHLGVMTASPIALSATATAIDFTVPTTATYSANDRANIDGVLALWTGNAVLDNSINANDRSETWNDRNTNGYMMSDVNMDGVCNAADRSMVWNNRNKSRYIP